MVTMNDLAEIKVNNRVVISSLWISMLLVYAYVDIFSLFRADVLQNALEGRVFVFDANQWFFVFTTGYVLIPSVMIFLTLILKARLVRSLNVIIPLLYILTISGSVVGEEWWYYWMGSIFEVIILLILIRFAWKWPKKKVQG
jgi:hypothetical protein